jgi:heme exporter protein B
MSQSLSLGQTLWALLARDLKVAARRQSDLVTVVFFFGVVAALFPLAVGPEMGTLRLIGPGILWVAALLAAMLSMGRLFWADYLDGSLEQLLLSPTPLPLMVASKIAAHWLLSGLPLVILSPVLALQFDLSGSAMKILMLTLLVGSMSLSLIGAVGAALTLGLRGSELLLSLLVLPLYIPTLVFGAGAVQAEITGLGAQGHVSLLMAVLMLALFLCPWAAASALKIALE